MVHTTNPLSAVGIEKLIRIEPIVLSMLLLFCYRKNTKDVMWELISEKS